MISKLNDALRDSPVVDGWCWLTLADAVDALRSRWSALGVAGQCGLNGGTAGARMTSLEGSPERVQSGR